MKKIIFFYLCLVLTSMFSILSAQSYEKNHIFGIGVSAGSPNGIDFKLWLSKFSAFNCVLSWEKQENVYFHIDYLQHRYNLIPKEALTGDVPFYYGAGIKIENNINQIAYGFRITLGMSYILKEMPVDVSAEISPTAFVYPSAGGVIGTCIKIRYYFE